MFGSKSEWAIGIYVEMVLKEGGDSRKAALVISQQQQNRRGFLLLEYIKFCKFLLRISISCPKGQRGRLHDQFKTDQVIPDKIYFVSIHIETTI